MPFANVLWDSSWLEVETAAAPAQIHLVPEFPVNSGLVHSGFDCVHT